MARRRTRAGTKRRQHEVSRRGTVDVHYGRSSTRAATKRRSRQRYFVDDWSVAYPDRPSAKARYKRSLLRTTVKAAKKDALRVAKALRSLGFKARVQRWDGKYAAGLFGASPRRRTKRRTSRPTRRLKRTMKRRTSRITRRIKRRRTTRRK